MNFNYHIIGFLLLNAPYLLCGWACTLAVLYFVVPSNALRKGLILLSVVLLLLCDAATVYLYLTSLVALLLLVAANFVIILFCVLLFRKIQSTAVN